MTFGLLNELRYGATLSRKKWVRPKDVASVLGRSERSALASLEYWTRKGELEARLDPKDGRRSVFRLRRAA